MAASDAAIAVGPTERAARAEKRRTNRGSLPAHLPRLEIVVDIDSRTCPWASCTGSGGQSERLDIVPARSGCSSPAVRIRPPALRRWCRAGPRARATDRSGMPTEATIAQVLVSKYADHLPLSQLRSTPGKVSSWIDPRWRTGSATRGTCVRGAAIVCGRDDGAGARSWPGVHQDRSALPLTTGHGAAVIHRAPFTSTHPIANPNGPSPIWRASRAFCRSTVMPAIASSPTEAMSALHSAGRTFGVASMSSPYLVRHRSPAKRSNVLPGSTPSRKTSAVEAPRGAEQFVP